MLQPGSKVQGYTVVAPLAELPTSEAWRVIRDGIGSPGVLYVLRRAGTTTRARALADVSALVGLNHPHLLPVEAAVEVEGTLGVVTAEPVGEPLRARCGTRMPPHEAALVVRQVALAVEAAHAKGVVHGGISPDIVAIQAQGAELVARLTGFGLHAKEAGAVAEGLSAPLGYAAPEALRGEAAGPSADVFALGALLYELVVGVNPFIRDSVQLTQRANLAANYVAAQLRVPACPRAVLDAIDGALKLEVADRFDSVGAFVAAIGGGVWLTPHLAPAGVTAPRVPTLPRPTTLPMTPPGRPAAPPAAAPVLAPTIPLAIHPPPPRPPDPTLPIAVSGVRAVAPAWQRQLVFGLVVVLLFVASVAAAWSVLATSDEPTPAPPVPAPPAGAPAEGPSTG